MIWLLTLFHLALIFLSAYTGLFSYTAITKLLTYEEKAKKAAKYSNHAARELHTSRTTQTSGAVMTIVSLVSSLVLLIAPPIRDNEGTYICLFNVFLGAFAYQHMKNFWESKSKIPFLKDYSDAISISNTVKSNIGTMTMGWTMALVGHLFKSKLQ